MRAKSSMGSHVTGSCQGQALVETVVLLPLLLLIALNAINFGSYIYAWITVDNAARAAAQYKVYNGVALGSNGTGPSNAAVQAFAKTDATSLPSSSSRIAVTVCSNFNGSSSCAPARADNLSSQYTAWTIDVQYSYVPIIPAFTIPVINVPLTLSSTTIDRTVFMRNMQ
jgi:Flp pilus assembly protein TadG